MLARNLPGVCSELARKNCPDQPCAELSMMVAVHAFSGTKKINCVSARVVSKEWSGQA